MPSELIFETLVTTASREADGALRGHVAPMGLRRGADGQGDDWVLMPFRPSGTLDNILALQSAVVNFCDDVRVFAGCVTGRRDWPLQATEHVPGLRLQAALAHAELQLRTVDEHPQRPTLHFECVHLATHAPFAGYNRAQSAVIEGAVLVSRLHLLPAEKIDTELRYLQIGIDKTAGPREHQAWGWLLEAVAAHRARTANAHETSSTPAPPASTSA
jgi:uncharacterized protein